MSGLAGVFYTNGRPVGADVCSRIQGDLSAASYFHAPGFLMAAEQSLRHKADNDKALAVSPWRNVCTFDGILHNRNALMWAVGGCATELSDAAIALAVYERGGTAALGELVGDWSLALWDQRRREMILASDYAGIRPLYYCESGGCFRWASSLQLLSRWSGCEELDENYAASFLTGRGPGGWSPYRGIRSVPAHCAIRMDEDGVKTDSFWELPADAPEIQDTDEGYAERFCYLFREAVACRMETGHTVCVELSGGMDSSSIASMAAALIRSGAVNSQLLTITYDEPGSLDRVYAEHMEKQVGFKCIHVSIPDHPPITATSAGLAEPLWWQPRFEEVRRQLAQAGSEVLLTGQLGDLVTGNWMDDSEQVGDYLARGRVFGAVSEALAWSRSLRAPVYRTMWRGLRSVFSPGWFDGSSAAGGPASVLAPAFLRRYAGKTQHPALARMSPSRRKHAWFLLSMLKAGFLRTPEPLQDVRYSHPFVHRPLIEFLSRVPSGVICRPGAPRRLMRYALRGLVPEGILARRSKALYNGSFLTALRPLGRILLRDIDRMQVLERGWIDRNATVAALQRLCDGIAADDYKLRHLIAMEFWLRNRPRLDPPCVQGAFDYRQGLRTGLPELLEAQR